MLRELHIRNFAVVEDATIEFADGLNVLTGETGAGKSIVVDALGLLAGARASGESIRSGAETLTVVGRFEPRGEGWPVVLEEAGFGADGREVVIRREVSKSGKNRVYLDDRPITSRLLTQLAPFLLRIHTQREELGLVSNDLQRRWLDRSSGRAGQKILDTVAQHFRRYHRLAARWQKLSGDDKLRLERIDLLRFQVGEIKTAQLREGEEVDLRQRRDVLRNAEAIVQALGGSLAALHDDDTSAADQLGKATRLLEDVATWLRQAGVWADRLAEQRSHLDDVVAELRSEWDRVDAEPSRLNEIEDRLAELERLFRKYGDSSSVVLTRLAEVEDELRDLSADEDDRVKLEVELADATSAYCDAATALSSRRADWASKLSGSVHRELADLAMSNAKLSVELEHPRREGSPVVVDGEAVDFGERGFDRVVFMLQANPGEAAGPVAKVASGGELARLYLALQLAARGEQAADPGLVFDEVDAGIGGAQAAALGSKLKRLSTGGQILVVTHLAQVASFGDAHFHVSKVVNGGRTRISVRRLENDDRIEETARMLAGSEVTDLSRSHAAEMISSSG